MSCVIPTQLIGGGKETRVTRGQEKAFSITHFVKLIFNPFIFLNIFQGIKLSKTLLVEGDS